MNYVAQNIRINIVYCHISEVYVILDILKLTEISKDILNVKYVKYITNIPSFIMSLKNKIVLYFQKHIQVITKQWNIYAIVVIYQKLHMDILKVV